MLYKKHLYVAAACIAFVGAIGWNIPEVSAAIEDNIYNLVRAVDSRLTMFQQYVSYNHADDQTRFDTLDAKMDRLYESCGRQTAPARRVTLAQVNTCVEACFRSSAVGPSERGAMNRDALTACITRCPSNTLRNTECAQNYTSRMADIEEINGERELVALTPAAYIRHCAGDRCSIISDLFRTNLNACLFDQRAYSCQSDCTRNFRSEGAFVFCQLRCQDATRATQRVEQLREAGIIGEDGRLSVDAFSGSILPALTPAAPAAPAPTITGAPTVETYASCVYRCDSQRTACLAGVPQPTSCQSEYDTCYGGCSSRLNGGASGTSR